METENIINNEEVNEILTNEMIEAESTGNGIKAVLGLGAVAVCGLMVYRFVIRPRIKKLKAKKEGSAEDISKEDSGESLDEEFPEK